MRHSKFGYNILIVLFSALLALPALNHVFGFLQDSESLENRKLSDAPAFNIKKLDPFPSLFETYYNEHFQNRNRLIKLYNDYKLRLLNKSAFPDEVVIGNDGWLFLAKNDIDDYTGKNAFTNDELQAFKLELEYRKSVLDSMHCQFVFAIAPGKPNIYPEKVPFSCFRYSDIGWGEQLLTYLEQTHCSVSTLDLYSVFREKKSEHPLYYKLDTHWNSWGALTAAQAIAERVHLLDSSLTFGFPKFKLINEKTISEGNVAKILGNPDFLKDTEFTIKSLNPDSAIKQNERCYQYIKKPNPVLLINGDSFTTWLLPILSQGFGTTYHEFDMWQYKLDRDELINKKPNVYLLLIHEPLLKKMLEHQARLGK